MTVQPGLCQAWSKTTLSVFPQGGSFISLYLLNVKIYQVDTLHGGRYWSEVLCCTIMTHLSDPEVKVTDFDSL